MIQNLELGDLVQVCSFGSWINDGLTLTGYLVARHEDMFLLGGLTNGHYECPILPSKLPVQAKNVTLVAMMALIE